MRKHVWLTMSIGVLAACLDETPPRDEPVRDALVDIRAPDADLGGDQAVDVVNDIHGSDGVDSAAVDAVSPAAPPCVGAGKTYYVHAGAEGNNDGSSWTHAFNELDQITWSALQPGDLVCVAGGTYHTQLNVEASGSGDPSDTRITVRKATAANHGTDEGWLPDLADAVVLRRGVRISGQSYLTVDGAEPEGIQIPSDAVTVGVSIIESASYVTLQHLLIDGSSEGDVFRGVYIVGGNPTHITLRRLRIQYMPNDAVVTRNVDHLTIEHSNFGPRIDSASGKHNDLIEISGTSDCIFRFNVVDYAADQLHFGFGGDSGRWDIYGNVFAGSGGGQAIKINSIDPTVGPLHVYNNVFVSLYRAMNARSSKQEAFVKNNIFHDIQVGAMASYTFDTNYYGSFDDPAGKPADANPISGDDPFVDASSGDYRLRAGAGPIDKGLNLGADYDTDADGQTRGADGAWDIGAYEWH